MTFSDIAGALRLCLAFSANGPTERRRAQRRVEADWSAAATAHPGDDHESLACLSVRSGFDLFLSAANLPPGSEVIMSAVTIPDMSRLVRAHGLVPVAVDVSLETLSPSESALRAALSPRSRVLVVAHVFGAIADLSPAVRVAHDAGLLLVEDCAEAFDCGAYRGHADADVSLFSFGTIKTATALGGGILCMSLPAATATDKQPLLIRRRALLDSMRRTQSLQAVQPVREFAAKVAKCAALHAASTPSVYGALVGACSVLRVDHDGLVTRAVRGFPGGAGTAGFLRQIRRAPSAPLLRLLARRIAATPARRYVEARIHRCVGAAWRVRSQCGEGDDGEPLLVVPGALVSRHAFWLFPVCCNDAALDPKRLCAAMLARGFDVTQGTTQLGCMDRHSQQQRRQGGAKEEEREVAPCSEAHRMMDRLVYLPITPEMTTERVDGMVDSLIDVCNRLLKEKAVEGSGSNSRLDDSGAASGSWQSVLRFQRQQPAAASAVAIAAAVLVMYVSPSLIFSPAAILLRLSFWILLSALTAALAGLAALWRVVPAEIIAQEDESLRLDFCRRSAAGAVREPAPILDWTLGNRRRPQQPPSRASREGDCGEGRVVFLTGGTGFVGSAVLLELLRQHVVGPAPLSRVFVLAREKKTKSAASRMAGVCESLARLLPTNSSAFTAGSFATAWSDLVEVVEGDVTNRNCGLDTAVLERLAAVTHILHCAASVSFTQPLHVAAKSNITGPLVVQSMARRWDARMVHVSTAFAHPVPRPVEHGNDAHNVQHVHMPSTLTDLHGADAETLYRSALGSGEGTPGGAAVSAAQATLDRLGFINTYSFTKALAEHLLCRDSDMVAADRLRIVRPAVIGPSWRFPYSGWSGSRPSTMTACVCLTLARVVRCYRFCATGGAPVIPVDTVASAVIESAFSPSTAASQAGGGSGPRIVQAAWNWPPASEKETASAPMPSFYRMNQLFLAYCCLTGHQLRAAAAIERRLLFVCRTGNVAEGTGAERAFPRWVFSLAHLIFHRVPAAALRAFCGRRGALTAQMLELPIAYEPFSSQPFEFAQALSVPEGFDGDQYLTDACIACERFISKSARRRDPGRLLRRGVATTANDAAECEAWLIAGSECPTRKYLVSDLWWAAWQPGAEPVGDALGSNSRGGGIRGTCVRLVAAFVSFILRKVSSSVTVDTASLHAVLQRRCREARERGREPAHVVFAPTHRSVLDFVLMSYICFALPELGLPLPRVCADREFSRLGSGHGPLAAIGRAMTTFGAFFVDRESSKGDGKDGGVGERRERKFAELERTLADIKADCGETGACFEVFLEGTRSRDRRFLRPRTGVMRSLIRTGGDHYVVPITISYEEVPEAEAFAHEAAGASRVFHVVPLLRWLGRALTGKIRLGRIHVSAGDAVTLSGGAEHEVAVAEAAIAVQRSQMSSTLVSERHLVAGLALLAPWMEARPSLADLRDGLIAAGCTCRFPEGATPRQAITMLDEVVLGSGGGGGHSSSRSQETVRDEETVRGWPLRASRHWALFMQWGHWLVPRLLRCVASESDEAEALLTWVTWLARSLSNGQSGGLRKSDDGQKSDGSCSSWSDLEGEHSGSGDDLDGSPCAGETNDDYHHCAPSSLITGEEGGGRAAIDDTAMALIACFRQADRLAAAAKSRLAECGWQAPSETHLLRSMAHIIQQQEPSSLVPVQLAAFAARRLLEVTTTSMAEGAPPLVSPSLPTIIRRRHVDPAFADAGLDVAAIGEGKEAFGRWGFDDTRFLVAARGPGSAEIMLQGPPDRYALCGRRLPRLVPFLAEEMELSMDELLGDCDGPGGVRRGGGVLPSLPLCRVTPGVLAELAETLGGATGNGTGEDERRLSTDEKQRWRHGTGHALADMWLLGGNACAGDRPFVVPDAVVWPRDEDAVRSLVEIAVREHLLLIPFGGGTNVTHATWCPQPHGDVVLRPVLSVDMRRMNLVLWVNERDGLAHVEAGITGRQLVDELGRRGLTMGHEPDSYEFSTLGGWIATHASGMKQTRYGNIEDMVREVRIITAAASAPEGAASARGQKYRHSRVLWQHHDQRRRGGDDDEAGAAFGRVSAGTSLTALAFGSEGCLGVITSAVVRVHPLPAVRHFDSVLFPSWLDGVAFTREVASLPVGARPASLRLVDNAQFRLAQCMKAPAPGLGESIKAGRFVDAAAALGGALGKFYALHWRGWDVAEMVAATVVLEGDERDVAYQRARLKACAVAHGGMFGGAAPGRAGYELTFAIAYLRDFALHECGILAESFETFVPWSKASVLCERVLARVEREHAARGIPGRPLISARVTQLYHEGACVYFYYGMCSRGRSDALALYQEIEEAAREEVLHAGGSLSHHHGIGKLRARFCAERVSPGLRDWLREMKRGVDPSDVFGAGNNVHAEANKNMNK